MISSASTDKRSIVDSDHHLTIVNNDITTDPVITVGSNDKNIENRINTRSIYHVADGTRRVLPYVHTFTSFAKGRWLGRPLLEVLSKEFGAHPVEYWKNAIKLGHVRINNKVVDESYVFRNSDQLIHRTHR